MADTAYLKFDHQSRQMRLIRSGKVLLARHIPEPQKRTASRLDLRKMATVRAEFVRFAVRHDIQIGGAE